MQTANIATQTIKVLRKMKNPSRALATAKYLQVFPGGYGHPEDIFYGLTVPETRAVAMQFRALPFPEVKKLFRSRVHEERTCATMIWCEQYRKGGSKLKKRIYSAYLANRRFMNNWDLIDGSAPYIVGAHVHENKKERARLYRLAASKNIWDRRIAIVSTQYLIRQKEFSDTLKLARLLLRDKHDLIHKASGWMLRELGKKDEKLLRGFLDQHAAIMPRTMLRYCLERLPKGVRAHYMAQKSKGTRRLC